MKQSILDVGERESEPRTYSCACVFVGVGMGVSVRVCACSHQDPHRVFVAALGPRASSVECVMARGSRAVLGRDAEADGAVLCLPGASGERGKWPGVAVNLPVCAAPRCVRRCPASRACICRVLCPVSNSDIKL